jgi:pimeloyl-ACP methyl ester carboxylesterase
MSLPSINSSAELHWRERGTGSPVLLIHGLGSSGADWAFQAPALAARHRVIAPDLRGCGASAPLPRQYSIADYADDLRRLLDRLALDTTDVVGFSFGGAVALELALRDPARVRRLVKINSLASYRVDHWRKWLEVYGQLAAIRVLGLKRTARGIAHRLFPSVWQHAMRARVEAVIGNASLADYLIAVRALNGWSALERVDQLRARTFLLAAEYDYTPLPEKREHARRLGAQFAVVQGSRHGTPFDAIGATNAALLAFLADAPLPQPLRADLEHEAPAAAPEGWI